MNRWAIIIRPLRGLARLDFIPAHHAIGVICLTIEMRPGRSIYGASELTTSLSRREGD